MNFYFFKQIIILFMFFTINVNAYSQSFNVESPSKIEHSSMSIEHKTMTHENMDMDHKMKKSDCCDEDKQCSDCEGFDCSNVNCSHCNAYSGSNFILVNSIIELSENLIKEKLSFNLIKINSLYFSIFIPPQ
jgi:hypothetical protein